LVSVSRFDKHDHHVGLRDSIVELVVVNDETAHGNNAVAFRHAKCDALVDYNRVRGWCDIREEISLLKLRFHSHAQ
jgi:hypothetical protein